MYKSIKKGINTEGVLQNYEYTRSVFIPFFFMKEL
jgi:hypothetical protein